MIFTSSERLILRRPREEDYETLLETWSHPEMIRWTPHQDDRPAFIAQLIQDMQAKQPGDREPGGPWYQFVIERRQDGATLGDVGVGFWVPGERQVELGYRIHLDHQRQGYAREAVAAIIDWLIEAHDVHRFVGIVAAPHRASIAVLRALGFREEGLFRESFWCNGRWEDDAYFALLASERVATAAAR